MKGYLHKDRHRGVNDVSCLVLSKGNYYSDSHAAIELYCASVAKGMVGNESKDKCARFVDIMEQFT
jgi:hypothetical protein